VVRSAAKNTAGKHQETPAENSGKVEQKLMPKFWEQIGNKTGEKAVKNEKTALKTFATNSCSQKQL